MCVALAGLVATYGGLAVWSVLLYRQGLTARPFEALLVFGVYYPVWICGGGPWQSELERFQYVLETRDHSEVIRYEVTAYLSDDDPDAPALLYSQERLNTRTLELLVKEERLRLSSVEADAIEKAVIRWRGLRRKSRQHGDPMPLNHGAKDPLLFFKAEVRKPGWAGLYTDAGTWEDWQIDGTGFRECSKARSLIESLNQALPPSIRKNHALPLPPVGRNK